MNNEPSQFGTGVREGDVIAGKYRVEKVLGVGGMGVDVARHVHRDEKVALKFLLPQTLENREAVDRFLREARPSWLLRRSAGEMGSSGGSSVVMMKAAEDRERDDAPLVGAIGGYRSLLAKSLVRARGVVVARVLGDDALEVPVIEHQQVVEALTAQRAEEALADGVHVRRAHGGADHSDARGPGERIEVGPELVVAIANQEPQRGAERGRVAKLLRHPSLRRDPCRRCEHDFAGGEFDEHKREGGPEEHVVGLQEVAGPSLLSVVSQVRRNVDQRCLCAAEIRRAAGGREGLDVADLGDRASLGDRPPSQRSRCVRETLRPTRCRRRREPLAPSPTHGAAPLVALSPAPPTGPMADRDAGNANALPA